MKRTTFCFCILFCSHSILAQEKIDHARVIINELLDIYPGISVTVGKGNEIFWSEGFGFSGVESKTNVTTESKFRYYSLSKSITGIAIVKLVSLGKLDITKQVTAYLSFLPESYKNVTVAQLISHTAGVRDYNKGEWMKISSKNCESARDAINVFINDPLQFEPGTKKQYSSFGYVLLSAVIEEISGKSFYEFIQNELFKPLNINDIGADQSEKANQNQVSCYDKWDRQKMKFKIAPEVNNTCKFGSGGWVGTSSALVKLHLAMLNGKIVEGIYQDLYYNSFNANDGNSVSYAFGINVGDDDGVKYYSHSGSAVGANCVLIIFPSEKLVIVILGNLESNAMNSVVGKIGTIFRDN